MLKSVTLHDWKCFPGTISFRIHTHAPVIALMGPNGAGKTTMIQAIEFAINARDAFDVAERAAFVELCSRDGHIFRRYAQSSWAIDGEEVSRQQYEEALTQHLRIFNTTPIHELRAIVSDKNELARFLETFKIQDTSLKLTDPVDIDRYDSLKHESDQIRSSLKLLKKAAEQRHHSLDETDCRPSQFPSKISDATIMHLVDDRRQQFLKKMEEIDLQLRVAREQRVVLKALSRLSDVRRFEFHLREIIQSAVSNVRNDYHMDLANHQGYILRETEVINALYGRLSSLRGASELDDHAKNIDSELASTKAGIRDSSAVIDALRQSIRALVVSRGLARSAIEFLQMKMDELEFRLRNTEVAAGATFSVTTLPASDELPSSAREALVKSLKHIKTGVIGFVRDIIEIPPGSQQQAIAAHLVSLKSEYLVVSDRRFDLEEFKKAKNSGLIIPNTIVLSESEACSHDKHDLDYIEPNKIVASSKILSSDQLRRLLTAIIARTVESSGPEESVCLRKSHPSLRIVENGCTLRESDGTISSIIEPTILSELRALAQMNLVRALLETKKLEIEQLETEISRCVSQISSIQANRHHLLLLRLNFEVIRLCHPSVSSRSTEPIPDTEQASIVSLGEIENGRDEPCYIQDILNRHLREINELINSIEPTCRSGDRDTQEYSAKLNTMEQESLDRRERIKTCFETFKQRLSRLQSGRFALNCCKSTESDSDSSVIPNEQKESIGQILIQQEGADQLSSFEQEMAQLRVKAASVHRELSELESLRFSRVQQLATLLRPIANKIYNAMTGQSEANGPSVDIILPDSMSIQDGVELHGRPSCKPLAADIRELSNGEAALVALSLSLAMGILSDASVYIVDEVDYDLDTQGCHYLMNGLAYLTDIPCQVLVASHRAPVFNQATQSVGLYRSPDSFSSLVTHCNSRGDCSYEQEQ